METLTSKELAFLKALDDSEYGDEITDPIWTWNIAENIEDIDASSLGGIAASLNKKGLIWSDEDAGDENCTSMTEEGAKLYIETIGIENLNKYHDKYAPVETMRPIWDARRAAKYPEE